MLFVVRCLFSVLVVSSCLSLCVVLCGVCSCLMFVACSLFVVCCYVLFLVC